MVAELATGRSSCCSGPACSTAASRGWCSADPGFRAGGVAVLQVFAWDRQTYAREPAAFFQETLASIEALPGVAAAGAVSRMPFIEANINIRLPLTVEGRPKVPGQDPSAS